MSILETSLLTVILQRYFYYWGSNLFFGMCFSVPCASRSLVSADSAGKFYLKPLSQGRAIL